jgi:anaerobic ribonucleoside-triphosphate reductase activating protein
MLNVSKGNDSSIVNFGLHPRDTPITTLNGPGRRFALWVQGCSLLCTKRCLSPHLLSPKPKLLVSVKDTIDILADRASRESETIEGITLLGGEPTDQAASLCLLAEAAQALKWSVVTYSGYTLADLQRIRRTEIDLLLKHTDILIDGPYQPDQANPLLRWRGSSNQKIWLLSTRYSIESIGESPVQKGVDITITTDGRLIVSGVQSDAMRRSIGDAFRRNQIIR